MYGVFMGVAAVAMACLALVIRMKAMNKPATRLKIVIPPIAMSTGFLMFLYPPTRPNSIELLEAFSIGLLFSILLIKISSFEIRDNNIFMKRSKVFPFILFGLLAIRLVVKLILGIHFEYEVLAGMFFVLAFGMILPWRMVMLVKFNKLDIELKQLSGG